MDNPWNIQSIYELQYFNCPSCLYKNHCKQELINHAYECHPESIDYLANISDKSLSDINLPSSRREIKTEINTDLVFPNDEYIPEIKIETVEEHSILGKGIEDPLNVEKLDSLTSTFGTEYEKSFEQFQCPYCNKTYVTSSSLKNHIHKHEKSYDISPDDEKVRKRKEAARERQKRYRERLKSNPEENKKYLAKEAQRKKKERQKESEYQKEKRNAKRRENFEKNKGFKQLKIHIV